MSRSARSSWLLLLLTVLISGGCTSTRQRDPSLNDHVPLDANQRSANLQAFDEVWAKVNTTYFNPARLAGGDGMIDWAALRTELRPSAERARTRYEARAAINTLLEKLGETHFALLPADLYEPLEAGEGSRTAEVGIVLRVVGSQATVWRVLPDSPAAKAGIRPGWTLMRVDHTDVARIVEQATNHLATTRPTQATLQGLVQNLLTAEPKKPIRVAFIDGRGDWRRRRLIAPEAGATDASLGNLPTMSLRMESKTLDGSVGYFSLSSFLDPPRVMPAFDAFVRKHSDAAGLIIDLRGNSGGLSSMASGFAGYFVKDDGASLGTMIMREGRLNLNINPRLPTYEGKVAVLIDALTASTSEIFAAGLRDLGRARLFGERTGGAALPSVITRLSNGDRFQYAVADFVRTNNERLEGVGVVPDESVQVTREDLLTGRDAALDAALAWIRSPATTSATTTTSPATEPALP